jgi:hypothetical protein
VSREYLTPLKVLALVLIFFVCCCFPPRPTHSLFASREPIDPSITAVAESQQSSPFRNSTNDGQKIYPSHPRQVARRRRQSHRDLQTIASPGWCSARRYRTHMVQAARKESLRSKPSRETGEAIGRVVERGAPWSHFFEACKCGIPEAVDESDVDCLWEDRETATRIDGCEHGTLPMYSVKSHSHVCSGGPYL